MQITIEHKMNYGIVTGVYNNDDHNIFALENVIK